MGFKEKFKVFFPVLILLVLSFVIVVERIGIRRETEERLVEFTKEYSAPVTSEAECLVLISSEALCEETLPEIELVLGQMKIPYDVYDLSTETGELPLDQYQTAIVTFQSYEAFGNRIEQLIDWLRAGGAMMTMCAPNVDAYFPIMQNFFGIDGFGSEYPMIDGMTVAAGSMVGANEELKLTFDPLATSIPVDLADDCRCYITSLDESVPLLWMSPVGDGRIVVNNTVMVEKAERGIWSFSYTLLEPICIYPVINASAYYLDDFPSPVPGGNGIYIQRDYGVDIDTFFSSVWWPQMLEWENQYGIKHTGLIIETYDDQVVGDLNRNYSVDSYISYGNVLLNNGGELGFHGYNHQPLCVQGIDDDQQFGGYNLWPDEEQMADSITELQEFAKGVYSESTFQVYVPPSNIISESGIKVLEESMPDIKVIASTYLPDAESVAFDQEFGIDEQGVVQTPRVTSGCLLDDYQKITALSELNFHYVQSHFTHPDDTLDEDRGAKEGWGVMSQSLESYIKWMTESAPGMRQVTGSEMGVAVQDYTKLSVDREEVPNGVRVHLGGFSNEASFLLRVDEGEIYLTVDCEVRHVQKHIYLVTTTTDTFDIYVRK